VVYHDLHNITIIEGYHLTGCKNLLKWALPPMPKEMAFS